MARSKGSKIELTAYDDLFETDESRAEAALSQIRDIPISEIDEFPDHPFKVLMDEDSHFIRLILDNPVYCGKIAYGRRTREKVKGTKN